MSLNFQLSDISSIWNPYSTALSLIVTLLIYVIYKIVLYPLIRMQFYRKQGIPTYYFPLVGFYKDAIKGLKEHGDIKYPIKAKAQAKPERMLVTNLGLELFILLFDPLLIKEFSLHPDYYQKDQHFVGLMTVLAGNGLGTSEGNVWKAQRKILSSSFHFEFLKSNIPVVQKEAHQALYNLRKSSLSQVNIMHALQKTTGEIFGKIFFGEHLNKYTFDNKPLTVALGELLFEIGDVNLSIIKLLLGANFVKRGILPSHRKLMQKTKDFRRMCHDIIIERKKLITTQPQEKDTKNMLDVLLTYNGEGSITDEEIVDQFITFFMGSMDTTAHLSTMVIYYLDQYPEYKKEMTEEVKKCYPYGNTVTIEDLNKLDFTMAVLKETLRTANPAPGMLPRKALRDYKLKDITIRKGDVVNIDFFYNNYNPEYFDEVEKYNPYRFLDKDKAIDAYAFTPFSAGPRNCIGQHFALIQARVILAEFFSMYDYKLVEGFKLKMDFRSMYEPKDPIFIDLAVKEA